MEPTAPSFEKMLVPVPVVFSPAAGWRGFSYDLDCRKGEEEGRSYGLSGGFVDAVGHVGGRKGAVDALVEGLGRLVAVHCWALVVEGVSWFRELEIGIVVWWIEVWWQCW